jgi:DNA repair protein RadC
MIDETIADLLRATQGDTSEVPEPGAALLARAAFTDVELVALLIGHGCQDEASSQAADKLMEECGGLAGLARASREQLCWRRLGLRSAQVAALRAACELGTRLALHRVRERLPLLGPRDLARYLALRYERRDQEVFGAVFVDTERQMIGEAEIARGTLRSVAVEPRDILKECLLRGAAEVVVFHTHPSGKTKPSTADRSFTKQLYLSCRELGVKLLDHLIIGGGGGFVSLRERGDLW